MPGCGKGRLIDFLLNKPGVMEKYGLPNNLKFIKVDCDIITSGPPGIYIELLRTLDSRTGEESSPDTLKNRLIAEVEKLEPETDLVVIFDNFTQPLQQALGTNFFNFLYGWRNSRPKLNISYIFMSNLKIDLTGFYKADRLFATGADRSIGWLSLFNRKDTFFSITRQLQRTEQGSGPFTEQHKERIYQVAGGHALLTRYLTHLMLKGDISLETGPHQMLEYPSIRSACTAIWDDLDQRYQNLLIDLATGNSLAIDSGKLTQILQSYGILKEPGPFFSPIFETFVKEQQRVKVVLTTYCDEANVRLVVKTIRQDIPFALHNLSHRKRRLLCYLVENQGETCHRDQLIKVGWPADDKQGVTYQALERQIEDIRKWLKKQEQLNQYLALETRWGEGYQLVVKG
jgi:hypothetical protein